WPGPPHRNPPDLGEGQKAVVEGRAVAKLLVCERVPTVASLIAGEASFLPSAPGERTPDRSSPAAPARLAVHASGWRRTAASRRACPSTRLPAASVRGRHPRDDRR